MRKVQDRTCFALGCKQPVPRTMLMCRPHWFKLPKETRDVIWRLYRPGQEKQGNPSMAYLQAIKAAQDWLHEIEEREKAQQLGAPADV